MTARSNLPKNVFIDIETIPEQPEEAAKHQIAQNIKAPATMKKQETIDAWHNGEGKYEGEKEALIEETYRKTSFDATKGQICSIAWAFDDGDVNVCGAFDGNDEKKVLQYFFDSVLIEMNRSQPNFVGHYVAGFDLKFIYHRAVILGIKPPFVIPFSGRHGSDFYCTQSAWCGYRDTIKMDSLAKALGVKGKDGMDGSKVWDTWKSGEYFKVCEYNIDDVYMVRDIYKKLTFS